MPMNLSNTISESNATTRKASNTLDYITVVRFPLMVLVVTLHSRIWIDGLLESNTLSLASVLYELIPALTMLAVPTFFVISGYLFFRNFPTAGKFPYATFVQKLKSRIFTLLIPYLFWNSFTIFVKATQYKLQHRDYLQFLSWDSYFAEQPIDFPLWYVRALMILCVLSPAIYLLLKTSISRTVVMATLLLTSLTLVFPGVLGVGVNSYLYFMAGAAVALAKRELSDVVRPLGRISLWGSLGFILVKIALFVASTNVFPGFSNMLSFVNPDIEEVLNRVYVLVGICAALYLAEAYVIRQKQKNACYEFVLSRRTQWLSASTFFILSFHTPIPYAISEFLLRHFLPFHHDLIQTSQLLLAPLINLALCLAAYALVLRLPQILRKVLLGHA